jgi:hypothetical protein
VPSMKLQVFSEESASKEWQLLRLEAHLL